MMMTKKQISSPLLFIFTVLLGLLSFTSNGVADTEKAKESFNKGLEYEKAKDDASAILSYQLCIKEDPNYVDAYLNLGTIQFKQKKYDEALNNFKIATEKDSKNVDAFKNLGKVEYTLQKYAEAEMSFKSAIAIKPDAETYKELGKVYYKKKNDAEVINSFNKCHELGGGDHLTYYMLGKAYEDSNKPEAIKALKKSASLKPDYYLAHSTLGQIYLNDAKYNEAAAAFKQAMGIKTKSAFRAAYNYAIAVESADPENYDANIANWNKYIKMAKGNPKAKNLATAEQHVKDLMAAKEQANLQ